MVHQDTLLVMLVKLVDQLPRPALSSNRGRGHPKVYSDRLFLKALVIMIVRHFHKVNELLSILALPTAEMATLRMLLSEQGQFPSRRTWQRRLKAIPETLPAQIGCFGRHLVAVVQAWVSCGRKASIDSTTLRGGGVWHQKHREKGELPHTSIDTEAHWTKSGWHALVYGSPLHLVAVAAVWIPLAAELTRANIPDSAMAEALLRELAARVRFILGDRQDLRDEVRLLCEQDGRTLLTTRYGRYPQTGAGVEVRRTFHKLRSVAIENFNEHFKGIFDGHGQVPTKGLLPTQRFALGAIFVYQLALLYRFEHDLELCVGLKAFLKVA